MLDLFRKSHPYIAIDHYRANETGIYNRVAIEATAGMHAVDVIESAASIANGLIEWGLIDAYHSPESTAMRPEFVDPKRIWHGYSYLVVGLGYNRQHLRESDLPKSYDDLFAAPLAQRETLTGHRRFGHLPHLHRRMG